MSVGQTVVQLRAPAGRPGPGGRAVLCDVRERPASVGSGFTVGLLGAAVGIHWSMGASAAALCLGTVAAGVFALRGRHHDIEAVATADRG